MSNISFLRGDCYVYRSGGQCTLDTHIYARGDSFLVELLPTSGSSTTFREAFSSVINAMGTRGILKKGSSADLQYAEQQNAAKNPAIIPERAATLETPPPIPSLPKCVDDSDLFEERSDTVVRTAPLPEGIVRDTIASCGLTTLIEELASHFDDVSTPTAQSLALMACDARIRATFGSALAYFYDAKKASLTATKPEGQLVLRLLSVLISRSIDVPTGATSIRCRSTCALALATFARQPEIADAVVMFGAAPRLIGVALTMKHTPQSACLRRQLARAFWHVITTSQLHLARSEYAFGADTRSGDPIFDAAIQRIQSRYSIASASAADVPASCASAAGASAAPLIMPLLEVPQPPFTLAPYLIDVTCSQSELLDYLATALSEARIDYEFLYS